MHRNTRRAALCALLALPLALSGCGGGGGSGLLTGAVLSGQVLMGAGRPVYAGGTANVCLYAIVAGQGNPVNSTVTPPQSTGTLLTTSCIPTDANGNFTADLTSFYGPVLIQVTSGNYLSAATGASAALTSLGTTNASLQAVVNIAGGGTVHAVVTPLTTVATAIALGNSTTGFTLSNATYAAATAKVDSEFQLGGLDINTAPTAGDAYDLALNGVQQYLAAPPGSTNDPSANNLLTWNLAGSSVAADFTSAYNAINHTSATFSFN